MKRFTLAGVNYTCKKLDIANDSPDVVSIRISSQGFQNMYIWRNGYDKPYALPNNVKVMSDVVILKAFKLLESSKADVKYEPKRNIQGSAVITTPTPVVTSNPIAVSAQTNSNRMYQVVDCNGNMSLFSSCDDVVKFSLGKMVTITEVFVSITPISNTPIQTNIVTTSVTHTDPIPVVDTTKVVSESTVVENKVSDVDDVITEFEVIDESEEVSEVPTEKKERRTSRGGSSSSRGKGRSKKTKVRIPDEIEEKLTE